jgi:DNA-binding transcriptional ArsR family regulator
MPHSDVFQALADPTRRRLLDALRHGERPVNDLVRQVGIHQSGVSRHLRILAEAGFVRMRPEGPHRFYSLQRAPFRELEDWVAPYRQLWDDRLDRLGAALKKTQLHRKAHRP